MIEQAREKAREKLRGEMVEEVMRAHVEIGLRLLCFHCHTRIQCTEGSAAVKVVANQVEVLVKPPHHTYQQHQQECSHRHTQIFHV